MAKQDLHVAVPSHFRCPISLEVMRSPVALCTGVTYDRSSIQAWLDAGNLTCPATMQTLPSADFVPNLSVHRLIHLWSVSLSSSPSPRHRLKLLMNRISAASTSSNELRLLMSSVLRLAKASSENRETLASSERFVASVVELMCKSVISGENEFLELSVMVLDLILQETNKSRSRDQIQKVLAPIASVLRTGKAESRISAAKVLESIAIDAESKREIAETEGLVTDLYSLVDSDDDRLAEAGLSALISLTTTRASKSELVRFGIVRSLANILSGKDRASPVIIKAMEMAEILATCSAGRAAICEDERIVAEVVRRLMKVSEKATEHGVTVLWSVCYLFRNKKAVDVVVGSNGLAKCLVVMQSKCSVIVRQMCRDLVKVLRVDSVAPGLASYDTKTTHIMPC